MKYLFILCCLLIVSCKNQEEKVTTVAPPVHFKVPDSNYVILPYNNKESFPFKNATTSSLTTEELITTEEILEKAVKKYNRNASKEYNTFPLKKYKRQYISVLTNQGEKEVYINFFCDDRESEDWKSQHIMVHDGGPCYFSIKINLTTKRYKDLMVNGHA
ncbi:hypothetical protein NBRC110019_25420 [Neptunitalea chrysea]|uniref:Lipoprotein n=1 Tax=Neptunitalea chrysea TaxID=1647581 RepID=A0A9W6B6M5_9FLAO|nr:hypothetical protein [Neptunitalea chrysea]GLB53501.1 hypothetical protein NBRC110019_25420 [Neptunitalea chrysea]